jgi:hypothetical protein
MCALTRKNRFARKVYPNAAKVDMEPSLRKPVRTVVMILHVSVPQYP